MIPIWQNSSWSAKRGVGDASLQEMMRCCKRSAWARDSDLERVALRRSLNPGRVVCHLSPTHHPAVIHPAIHPSIDFLIPSISLTYSYTFCKPFWPLCSIFLTSWVYPHPDDPIGTHAPPMWTSRELFNAPTILLAGAIFYGISATDGNDFFYVVSITEALLLLSLFLAHP